MPARVFDKAVVAAQIHRQRASAARADGQQFCRNFPILLPLDHFADYSFIIKGFLAARR